MHAHALTTGRPCAAHDSVVCRAGRWIGTDATQAMVADVALTVAPTRNGHGDLNGGKFSVTLPLTPPQGLKFGFDLVRTTDLPYCRDLHDLFHLQRRNLLRDRTWCVCPGTDWRVATPSSNGIVHPLASQWVASADWMLEHETAGVLGSPLIGHGMVRRHDWLATPR